MTATFNLEINLWETFACDRRHSLHVFLVNELDMEYPDLRRTASQSVYLHTAVDARRNFRCRVRDLLRVPRRVYNEIVSNAQQENSRHPKGNATTRRY